MSVVSHDSDRPLNDPTDLQQPQQREKLQARRKRAGKNNATCIAGLSNHPGLQPNPEHPLAALTGAELYEAKIRDLARVLAQIANRVAGTQSTKEKP